MAPITLLNKGALVAQMGERQEDLDNKVPIDYIMDWFGRQLETTTASSMSDRVVVLNSKTGSGKSTSIAPNLYLRFFNKYRKHIVITQPRVLTAMEIPKDIAQIKDYQTPNKDGLFIELYRNLGWQTKEFVQKPEEKGILFSTTGVLLQFLKTMSDEQLCKKYKFIIIDEAHDRSLEVDLVLLLMKRLIRRNLIKDAPFLILMSATLNVQQYSAYFDTHTIFEVNGQSKPIEVIYPTVDVGDIYAKASEIVRGLELYEEENPTQELENGIRDVIIFMPNPAPINRMISVLTKLNTELSRKILPISITRYDINNATENYRLIMEDPSGLTVNIDGKVFPAYRRVIVSTNVAETGLTLEKLRYCIDTGLQFAAMFNPRYGATILMPKPTTSSMSMQRKGRVGRKHPGVFYPLFTENTFQNMIVDNTPSIMVEDMTTNLLAVIASTPVPSVDRLPMYDMLTPPSMDSMNYSLERLFTIGAIDITCNITPLGKKINAFRQMNVESSKMILSGLVYGASLKELVAIACLLNYKLNDIVINQRTSGIPPYDVRRLIDEIYEHSPEYATSNRRDCDYQLKARLLVGCEMIELLLIYQRFMAKAATTSVADLKEWCASKGIVFQTLCNVTEDIDETCWQMLVQLGINPMSMANDKEDLYHVLKRSGTMNNNELIGAVTTLKKCIYEGYKNNLLVWHEKENAFKTLRGLSVMVKSNLAHKLSYQKIGSAFDQLRPRTLVYKSIIAMTNRDGTIEFSASPVSVMDGFVYVDTTFVAM
jgi:HrpA-like RNA helicase